MAMVKANDIGSVARLGRYFPAYGCLNYLAALCYLQSSFFSRIHFLTSLNLTGISISYIRILVNPHK
ncbi:MAG TPA: hypothetical protein VJ441_00690, partial [Dehalococcoidia bacterium]|nr:hypothetical protein [Dehalococcoidia bacterium]